MKLALILLIVLAAAAAVVYAVGARLPVRHTASRTVLVAAKPDAVWAAITRPAEFTSWRKGLKSVEVLSDAPPRWVEVDAHNQRMTLEVSENRPGEKLMTPVRRLLDLRARADGCRHTRHDHRER